MNEEEKKIKDMEELGIKLIDSPSETVAIASPTKLKLQALTFMIVGKVERHFLNTMLKQAKEARNLAEVGLRNVDMTLDAKTEFKEKLDSNITLLEDRIASFDKNYKRVMGRGRHSLKIPSVNFGALASKMARKKRTTTATDMIESYKKMNSIFSSAKKEFDGMPKPLEKDIDISKAEQDNIKKAVYRALSNTSDEAIEKYTDEFDKKAESKIDESIKKTISEKTKDEELDNFFNNVSPVKAHTKLKDEDLNQVLNNGKVQSEGKSSILEKENLNNILNYGKPIFNDNNNVFDNKPYFYVKENEDSEDDVKLSMDDNGKDVLSDRDIVDITKNLPKSKTNTLLGSPSSIDVEESISEIVPDVEDLDMQLKESINEIERKRKAKEEARKKYEAEKKAREDEENELSESKKVLEEMKREIERKREEQKAIEELNQKVEKALKYQKQIEENRRAALEEEEEARKYQETLRIERENQTKVAEEKEKIQSERAALQSETSKVNSSLQKEKERLEEAKRQLQMFNTSTNVSEVSTNPYSQVELFDVKKDDFFAGFTSPSASNDEVLVAITPKGLGDEKTSRRR